MELRQARNPTEKSGNVFHREFMAADFREMEGRKESLNSVSLRKSHTIGIGGKKS